MKDKFNFGIGIVLLTIGLSLFSFLSQENNFTGYVVNEDSGAVSKSNLAYLNDFDSLSILAPGKYFIDNQGFVYWIDDESKPAVAKIGNVNDFAKNKQVYVDKEGRVGFVLEIVEHER